MSPSVLERIKNFFDVKEYSELIDFFDDNNAAISNQEDKLKAYHLAAKSCYYLGRNKEAFEYISWVRNTIEETNLTYDEMININLDYGRILRRLGRREEAKQIYQEILDKNTGNLKDETSATIFHNLANIYLETGDFGSSSDYFNQALEIDQRTENHKGLSLSYSGLGSLNFYLGKFDAAIEFYLKSLEFRKKTNDRLGEALILLNIGSSYASILDKEQAEKYLEESMKIFQDFKHKKGIQEVLYTKARMNFNLMDYSSVIKSLKFMEEEDINVQTKEQIELVNILIESMIRNGEIVRAEQFVERSIEVLKQINLEINLPLYEEFGKMMQLLSMIKFQLEKNEESLNVLKELEDIATDYNDLQSLVVVFFSKANLFYHIGSLEEAELNAEESEKLAKKIKHNSLPLILDVLFRIYLRLGNYNQCIKILKKQKRISESDDLAIELVLNTFQILAGNNIKTASKKQIKNMSEFQLVLLVSQVGLENHLFGVHKISKLPNLEKEIGEVLENKFHKLIPYFLLFKILSNQDNKEIIETSDKLEKGDIVTIYQRILSKQISKKELSEFIKNLKTFEKINLNQMFIILDIIFFGILNDLTSEKNLKLDFWKDIIEEKFREIVEIKQEILLEILKTEKMKEFSYTSNTAIGCLVTDILHKMLPKIFEIKSLTQEKLRILILLVTDIIIRTLVILFAR